MACPLPEKISLEIRKKWKKREPYFLMLQNSDDCITFNNSREIIVEPSNESNFLNVWEKCGWMDDGNISYLRCFVKKINHKIYIMRISTSEAKNCHKRLNLELVELPENWSWYEKQIREEHHPYWFQYESFDNDECMFRSLYNGKYLLKQTEDFKSVELRYLNVKETDYIQLPINYFFRMFYQPPNEHALHRRFKLFLFPRCNQHINQEV